MLESGLFFTLGFLCSAFLALMIAPAIWRRAVVLTRQRIESSVPLTLNEIQADKDQLRAEFAMSTRRLEVNLETLKERAAEQLIEVNRKRDEMLALEEQFAEKTNHIVELEAQSAELRSQMKEREERLNIASSDLAAAEMKLEEKSLAYEELQRRFRGAVDEFDGQKIELVARETRMESIKDEFQEIKKLSKTEAAENSRLLKELKAANTGLNKELKRSANLEEKVARLQATVADMEGRLERRDSDIVRLRSKSGDKGTQVLDLQKEIDNLHSDNVRLQAEVAQTTLRMEALLKDASGENIENAIATFETERRETQNELAEVTAERDALKIEINALQLANGDDWDEERRENALMRERINDLAAQVTSMTASLEGPDSPIAEILRKDSSAKKKSKSSKPEQPKNLADRIRALQAASEKA